MIEMRGQSPWTLTPGGVAETRLQAGFLFKT